MIKQPGKIQSSKRISNIGFFCEPLEIKIERTPQILQVFSTLENIQYAVFAALTLAPTFSLSGYCKQKRVTKKTQIKERVPQKVEKQPLLQPLLFGGNERPVLRKGQGKMPLKEGENSRWKSPQMKSKNCTQ